MTACRWCHTTALDVVLDLGAQPPADAFPLPGEPVRRTALRMGRCAACGLAQLLEDPGHREEPLAVEPAALREQAVDAVTRLAATRIVAPGRTFREFGSPHGGSWSDLLVAAGMRAADTGADLVVDVFGLMHDEDQRVALDERVAALAPGGTLALQFQPLERIVELGQWNALRHGHMAYYSDRALRSMLASTGLRPATRHEFALYGGTTLLTATSDGTLTLDGPEVDVSALADLVSSSTAALRAWLTDRRDDGVRVVGYGAASRTTPLLNAADVGPDLLPLVVDASPGKQGRVIPGVGVPIGDPGLLRTDPPDVVVLFLADLLDEVRAAFPQVERSGGRWAVADPTVRDVAPLPA